MLTAGGIVVESAVRMWANQTFVKNFCYYIMILNRRHFNIGYSTVTQIVLWERARSWNHLDRDCCLCGNQMEQKDCVQVFIRRIDIIHIILLLWNMFLNVFIITLVIICTRPPSNWTTLVKQQKKTMQHPGVEGPVPPHLFTSEGGPSPRRKASGPPQTWTPRVMN